MTCFFLQYRLWLEPIGIIMRAPTYLCKLSSTVYTYLAAFPSLVYLVLTTRDEEPPPYTPKSNSYRRFCRVAHQWARPAYRSLYAVADLLWRRTERALGNRRPRRERTIYQSRSSYRSPSSISSRMKLPYLGRIIAMNCVIANNTNMAGARNAQFDLDAVPIYIDNCATACITNQRSHCGSLTRIKRDVIGFSGRTSPAIYVTDITWNFQDDNGIDSTHLIKNGFYIPEATSCLLSPQHWAASRGDNYPRRNGTRQVTTATQIILEWDQRRHRRTIDLDLRGSNVGVIYTTPSIRSYNTFMNAYQDISSDPASPASDPWPDCSDSTPLCTFQAFCHAAPHVIPPDDLDEDAPAANAAEPVKDLDDEHAEQYFPSRDTPMDTSFDASPDVIPTGLDDVEFEEDKTKGDLQLLLEYHHRYGHLSFAKLRHLALEGEIPRRLAKIKPPMCTACLLGKATRKPWRYKPSSQELSRQRIITSPGQCVSVDQMVSSTPGYVAQLRGRATKLRYRVATVFVDHYSGLSYVALQYGATAEETILAKRKFEEFAQMHGVRVQHYHADNGIFADNKFRQAVRDDRQTLSFCGVNSHWQNGRAERRIRELTEHARTSLIHAMRRWPSAITTNLWPHALRYANDMHMYAPQVDGKASPMELFSGSKFRWSHYNCHTFGSPVYVLDNEIQAGQKVNKWSERARVGIFLGHSPEHAQAVSLVLSLTSGLTSPQFHCKYDDSFQTVKTSFRDSPPISKWQRVCGFVQGIEQEPISDKPKNRTQRRRAHQQQQARTQIGAPEGAPEGASQGTDDGFGPAPIIDPFAPPSSNHGSIIDQDGRRRSTRNRRTPSSLRDFDVNCAIFTLQSISPLVAEDYGAIHALSASADPDTMYWHQAMREPDRDLFYKAAEKEIEDHTRNGLWRAVPRSSVPEGTPIGRGVWAMKRKRKVATGEVYKHKARLAFDGSKQIHGVNYWDTYAPVTNWPIVRFVLTLCLLNKWHARQIDFVLAFCQADPEVKMYMEMPKGFRVQGYDPKTHVLEIMKNYYGEKQAGRQWYLYLVERLEKIGFKKSQHDDCLFTRGSCMYVLYTDDSILTGPDSDELDKAIQDMKSTGLDLTWEEGLGDFLGVQIERRDDGTIKLSQSKLIESILKDLHLTDPKQEPKPYKTPALSSKVLGHHDDEPDFDGSFNYRSVIGKLNYLERSTRPEIAQALHQCARFSANPKKSHGKAVRHIGRYLLGTRDKGLILDPKSMSDTFQVYVDSDFSGNYTPADVHHKDSARSRYGFVIFYAGCPVYWCSKLATEIALSTTEAELVALSHSLRTSIPMMRIAKELHDQGFPISGAAPTIHTKVFEDNNGALALANEVRFRPRTRHINVRYWHFVSYIKNKEVTIEKVASADNCSDIFTKPLDFQLFRKHRETITGWDQEIEENSPS